MDWSTRSKLDISNKDIGRQFRMLAELLLIHGKDERTADLLSGAAYRIQRMDEPLFAMDRPALAKLFRPPIVKYIQELAGTGALVALDDLIQLTPAGLFDMMHVKGLGGKKLHLLWKKAKIDTVEGLIQACKAGKISRLTGFGARTEQNIIAAVEALNSSATQFHYADVADIADVLVEYLKTALKTSYVSLCGDIRRQTNTVERIEVLAIPFSKTFRGSSVKKLLQISSKDKTVSTGHTLDEIPVTIYHVPKKDFAWQLFLKTGNDAHVTKVTKKLKAKATFTSESAIYDKAGLPYILPEMREDIAEWDYSKDPRPLTETSDIRGVVHNHSTWSDGVDTLEDFVQACRKKNYEYVVISDHSKNAHYAGGLKEEKLARQLEAIDTLNKKVAPFRIFKSIECDILVSGELDFPASILKKFDLVIISVHQQLKMTEEKATKRLIKAIENPATTILGHMTGRQLLVRPGYPLNFKKVIDACAANGVVIEVNANPYRLDMDWSHIPYALKKGVMISIDPDAHSIQEIDNIRWGVVAARKGGLTKDMTWNAMDLSHVSKWLRRHRKI